MLLLPQLGATDSQRFVDAETTHKRHTHVIKFGFACRLSSWHELAVAVRYLMHVIKCNAHATLDFRLDGRDCSGSFDVHLRSQAWVILKVLEVPEGSFIDCAGVA